MPGWLNKMIQIIGVVGNIWVVNSTFLPPKAQAIGVAGLSAAQGVAGALAHYYNPDGTSAATPYVPPKQ